MPRIFESLQPFGLEAGGELPGLRLSWQACGRLNAARDNVIWICHALTADADAAGWWPGMIGPGAPFDTDRYFVICANMPGSPYGSSSPIDAGPGGYPYLSDFPMLTIRDMATAFDQLRLSLGIREVACLVGASMGGQVALEWAIQQREAFRRLLLIATNAWHSPFGIAFNTAQRLALESDPEFFGQDPEGGKDGLAAARAVALLSYRGYEAFGLSQERDALLTAGYRAESYLWYQGEKLARRFNPWSYHLLSRAMDSHDIRRGRGPAEEVLAGVGARSLVVGISSDSLFPIAEQAFLARHIPDAQFKIIDSAYGHDGFLTETKALGRHIQRFFHDQTISLTI